MPVEVMASQYQFISFKVPISGPSNEDPPFRYNALHDIESVWWVGLWILFFKRPKGDAEPNEKSRNHQLQTIRAFPGIYEHGVRLNYLDRAGEFYYLTGKWTSNELLAACDAFESPRAMLRNLY